LPNVYPLEGVARKAMHHFFDESVNPSYQFPPPGKTFEVAYQAKPASENAAGALCREDCDLFFLAWLMKFDSVRADVAKKKLFCAAADKVNIRFNYRPTEDQGRVRTPADTMTVSFSVWGSTSRADRSSEITLR